jgi:pimeloyl-ACP methyl ester carboxylesterase
MRVSFAVWRKAMSLYVREAGPLDAPTIVFLHGLGLGSAMWQPQFERLPDYHCLAPDLPEHGKSTDAGRLTLDNASRCVAELIRDRVPGGRAHVVGLSMGGAVAVRLLLNAPELIDHVIVSGAATRIGSVLAALNQLNDPIIRLLKPDQLTRLILHQFHIPQRYYDLLLEDVHAVKPEALSHFNHELTRIELPHHVQAPLLILVGQKETFVAKRCAREMIQAIPGSLGMIAPDVGHVWNLEAPDLFAATIRAWITNASLPQELMPL